MTSYEYSFVFNHLKMNVGHIYRLLLDLTLNILKMVSNSVFWGETPLQFLMQFFCARARSGSSKKDRSISPSFIFPIPFVGFGLKRTCGCS